MFNIGFAELLLLLFIAVFIVGPKDLPKVARALGRAVRWLKQVMAELKSELGFDELEKEFKGIETEVRGVRNEVAKSVEGVDLKKDLQSSGKLLRSNLNEINQETRLSTDSKIPDVPAAPKKSLGFQNFKERNGYTAPEATAESAADDQTVSVEEPSQAEVSGDISPEDQE